MFGYSSAELVGQPVEILIPASLRLHYRKDASALSKDEFEGPLGAGMELRALRKTGEEFPIEISLSPLRGPNGFSMTAAIRDVSERHRAAERLAEKIAELRNSNEALEQFAHIASHDLQEPLRMVASYTQLLAKRYKGRLDADADEFIAFAVDGTVRMKRLIEDLLVYSRAGIGARPVREFASQLALDEALYNLRAAVEERGAEITQDQLPMVVSSDLQLVQIFQNLIGNAIKYSADTTPHVHISAVMMGEEWIFSIQDNGIGIAPEHFEKIFQIFQRLHGREEYNGTGIGLAICQRILHQLGGRIWVESDGRHGSLFQFSLPKR
jgi:PAS domain S-box-containing protein